MHNYCEMTLISLAAGFDINFPYFFRNLIGAATLALDSLEHDRCNSTSHVLFCTVQCMYVVKTRQILIPDVSPIQNNVHFGRPQPSIVSVERTSLNSGRGLLTSLNSLEGRMTHSRRTTELKQVKRSGSYE